MCVHVAARCVAEAVFTPVFLAGGVLACGAVFCDPQCVLCILLSVRAHLPSPLLHQDGHVIPGLIHKCYTAKATGTDFVIWGSGTPLRQFIHSHDLAALTVWTLREYEVSC